MSLHDGFRPRIEVVKTPSASTNRLRTLLLLNILAVLIGVFGLFLSLYFLAARLFDNVPYSALEVMLPVVVGTVAALVLQGVAMWKYAK